MEEEIAWTKNNLADHEAADAEESQQPRSSSAHLKRATPSNCPGLERH